MKGQVQKIDKDIKLKTLLKFNFLICFILVASLVLYFSKISFLSNENILIIVSVLATFIVYFEAIRSLKNKLISVDLLAGIALTVSLIEGQWISAIFINLMIASSRVFTNYVKIKSHSAISSLLKLKPEKAKIKKDGKIVQVSLAEVKKGDLVIVELGENIPIDGIIEEGFAEVDQSSLTGESLPVEKKKGEKVFSFTTIISGNLTILAEKVGGETTFEKIVSLVEKAEENKAPIYTIINKFANWYIVLTLAGSLIIYLIFKDITLVLGLLLVSCADDIAIATPIALMSAITHSAKHGAIVRGGDFLEAVSKIKTIIFDKTGTLTHGKLAVKKITTFDNTEKEVIKIAGSVSEFSSHPIAKTIAGLAKKKNISSLKIDNFEEYAGKGMTALYKGKMIVTGKPSFSEKMGIKISQKHLDEIDGEILKGFNVTTVGYDGKLMGYISLADELRPRAKETIKELKELGVGKIIMLTGDNEEIAKRTAEHLAIDEFHANFLPEDKLNFLKKYLNKKSKVAMVGDGVNDAPTLALSDVGIAMGAIGSDAAIESADIAMMKDDLYQITEVMRIGRATMRVINQNLVMWAGLNVLGFSLVFLRVLDPNGAAIFNFVTDFIPIINSLRLFK